MLKSTVLMSFAMTLGFAGVSQAESVLNLGVPAGAVSGYNEPVVTSGAVNGGQFQIGGLQPAGSGVLQSFLRVHSNGNASFEQGYNTDTGTPLDDVGGAFTHSIKVSDLQVTWINNVSYYGFVLDINQANSGTNPYLSLVALKLFQAGSGGLADFSAGTLSFPVADNATQIYDLDGAGNARVDINYQISSSGSGNADMFFYVPTASFLTDANHKYVYLYSAFGSVSGIPPFPQTDGYEEWATASSGGTPPPPQGVPLPTTAWAGISIMGALAGFRFLSKRIAAA